MTASWVNPTIRRHCEECLLRIDLRRLAVVQANGRFRLGFRMAAGRERSTRYRAAIRKPPKKEPAGSGEQLTVYGDLMGQRLRRGMSLPMSLRAEWRR